MAAVRDYRAHHTQVWTLRVVLSVATAVMVLTVAGALRVAMTDVACRVDGALSMEAALAGDGGESRCAPDPGTDRPVLTLDR